MGHYTAHKYLIKSLYPQAVDCREILESYKNRNLFFVQEEGVVPNDKNPRYYITKRGKCGNYLSRIHTELQRLVDHGIVERLPRGGKSMMDRFRYIRRKNRRITQPHQPDQPHHPQQTEILDEQPHEVPVEIQSETESSSEPEMMMEMLMEQTDTMIEQTEQHNLTRVGFRERCNPYVRS